MILWVFTGFGLSLTTFEIEPVSHDALVTSTQGATVSIRVKNTGTRDGDEVVFLFHNATRAIQAWSAEDPLAKKQLIGFERVSLAAGASTVVHFQVDAEMLSVVDKEGTRHALAGLHDLIVSRGHGRVLEHTVELQLQGQPRIVVSTMKGY